MPSVRLLAGISLFWLPLSMLSDGLTALVLPSQLGRLVDESARASTLGLLSFGGLLLAMLVQPLAGAVRASNKTRIWTGPGVVDRKYGKRTGDR